MKTVLWAGNDKAMAESLTTLFQRKQLRLIHGPNGMDALERLEAFRPDALVVEERFSHREWLLNIIAGEQDLQTIPVVIFPERARRRRPTSPQLPISQELIPVPIEGPVRWPLGTDPACLSPEPPDEGGNPDSYDAVREQTEFYVRLLTALELRGPAVTEAEKALMEHAAQLAGAADRREQH